MPSSSECEDDLKKGAWTPEVRIARACRGGTGGYGAGRLRRRVSLSLCSQRFQKYTLLSETHPLAFAGRCAAAEPRRGPRPPEVERGGRAHQRTQRQVLPPEVRRARAMHAIVQRERERARLFGLCSWSKSPCPRPSPQSSPPGDKNRWWNHLNPAVKKGAFSDWEDAVIIKVRGDSGTMIFFLLAREATALTEGGISYFIKKVN